MTKLPFSHYYIKKKLGFIVCGELHYLKLSNTFRNISIYIDFDYSK